MDVIQWCDDVTSVREIISRKQNQSAGELLELGCHWVPPNFPAEATIIEIIEEYELDGKAWSLVKVRITGAESNGYTLIRGGI